jgi:hypothetical protein
MVWNKGRLAYTPIGPYVAQRYEEGLSYGKIAQEVGISKGCVQNLCRAIGIPARENHTTNIADVWEQRLSDYVRRSGVVVVERPKRLTKKSRILTRCKHGTSERPCAILGDLQYCCQVGSKLGENNPAYGKQAWNSGRTDLSGVFTGRPKGSRNHKPFSEEVRQKYREARARITENGQPWSGFRRAIDEDREDVLYLVLLKNGKYKIGRSYKGANYRKREIKKTIGEWRAKSKHIWNIERKILTEFSEHRTPLRERSNGRGMTEWFELTLPIPVVKSRITQLLRERLPPSAEPPIYLHFPSAMIFV